MHSETPKKISISAGLLAEIKSAGRNYSKIKKAIENAILKFKEKNLIDQANTLESYYQENFRSLGWSGWIFLFNKDKDNILANLHKKINYLVLYESITTQFASTPKTKTTASALDQFYQTIINSTTQPLHSALSNLDQHQAVDKKKNPVLSAIKRADELKDMAHIKRNLQKMVDYLTSLQRPTDKTEKSRIAALFAQIRYQGVFASFTFDDFIQRLVSDAKKAQAIEDYATLLGKMQGIEQFILLFYNQQPERPKLGPLELKTAPTDSTPLPETPPTSLDPKAQEKLASALSDTAGQHRKKIQHFSVNFLTKGQNINQINPGPNQFYLVKQPDGEWNLYKGNPRPQGAPIEIPLYYVPGLKDCLQEEGAPDSAYIKELIFTYFTIEDQIKKFNHFDVEFLLQPIAKNQAFAVRPNKFYLAEQKSGGWKLYVPNKKATEFVEIEIAHFPGLQEILDETNPDNVIARQQFIKDFLFQFALSVHPDVYAKIDALLFNYVEHFINEVPPDFLKIFIAASLAKNYCNDETAIFVALCAQITRVFPEYNSSEFIAQMMQKRPAYDHVVLDFKKVLLDNLDEIEQTFTVKPATSFTQIRSAQEEKEQTVISAGQFAIRNLESLEHDFYAIIREADHNERTFNALFPRQWRTFQTSPPPDAAQTIKNHETVTQLVTTTEKSLEDLVALKRDAQLSASLADTPPMLKDIARTTLPKLDEKIKALEQRLKKYQAQAKITKKDSDKILEKKIESALQPIELKTPTHPTKKSSSREESPKKTVKTKPLKKAAEHFDAHRDDAEKIFALLHEHSAELLRVLNDTKISRASLEKDFLDWLQKKVITVSRPHKNNESRQITIKEHFDFDLEQIMIALVLAKALLPTKDQVGLRFYQEPHPLGPRHQLIVKLYNDLEKKFPPEKLASYREKCAAFMEAHPDTMTIEKFIAYCKKETVLAKRYRQSP